MQLCHPPVLRPWENQHTDHFVTYLQLLIKIYVSTTEAELLFPILLSLLPQKEHVSPETLNVPRPVPLTCEFDLVAV